MRFTFTIFIVFLQIACWSQDNKSSRLDVWDSLYLRHQQEEETFNTRLEEDFDRADTLAQKDSVVINFRAKRGELLKKIVYRLDSTGCRAFERFEYYNDFGQVVYTRRQRSTCPDKKGSRNNKVYFHSVHYERFRYDAKGRLILYIDTWADKPYRNEYQYNADGTVIRTSRKISYTEFWDE